MSEIENIKQLNFGTSMESVADSQAEVKLTAFNQINEQQQQQQQEINEESEDFYGLKQKNKNLKLDIIIDSKFENYSPKQSKENRLIMTDNKILNNISAVDLLEQQKDATNESNNQAININNKWPWSQLNNKFDQSQLNLDIQRQQHDEKLFNNQQQQQQVSSLNEPFQVVWQKLSFEVNVSAYDKFLTKFLLPMREKFLSKNYSIGDININTKEYANAENGYASSIHINSLDNNSNDINKRVIFKNLNGYFKSGEITAILGPSGAGKTSLLNAISGGGKTDNYRGKIRLIGGSPNKRMCLSIIPQRDYLIENLTVRENLLYASKILNPNKNFNHEENILRVSRMLNLSNCFNSKTSKISGGEYKRVSIAQELLRQPDILILDEPTSGLDSLNCKNLIKSLAKLIENSRLGYINPMAIIMTIHQPDIEIYQMFDHVYCMARHGKVIYDGHPKDTLKVIREQACLFGSEIETRLGSSSGNEFVSNPANLLIEIASENLYGQKAIDLLSDYQKRKFNELMMNNNNNNSNNNNREVLLSTSITPSSSQSSGNSTPEIMDNKNSINEMNAQKSDSIISNDNNLTSKNNINLSPSMDRRFLDNRDQLSNISKNSSLSLNTEISNEIFKNLDNNNDDRKKEKFLIKDKRLQTKRNHSGLFWHHTSLLAKRAFTATIRDPLMTIVALIFHLSIPFIMSTVYSPKIGTVNSCPIVQREFDLISLSSNLTMNTIKLLEDNVHTSFECSTMFFLTTYCFSIVSLTMAALAFPLNMHVLLKEVKNGWYNLSSFVLAKTISNSPFEILFPVISIVMIYILLGMPNSYMEWKLIAVALVMALVAMCSSTQGFLFGAIYMDSLPTAIFMSICFTLPQVVLSGFTSRINLMPKLLQHLSWLSLYRYSSDSINIIRFGYGNCPCSEETNNYLKLQQATFKDVPSNSKPLFNYYLSNLGNSNDTDTDTDSIYNNSTSNQITGISYDLILNSTERSKMINQIETNQVDIFDQMATLMSRAFSYGEDIKDCSDVRSNILLKAGTPKDEFLPYLFAGLFGILILIKVILFITVKVKISSRL